MSSTARMMFSIFALLVLLATTALAEPPVNAPQASDPSRSSAAQPAGKADAKEAETKALSGSGEGTVQAQPTYDYHKEDKDNSFWGSLTPSTSSCATRRCSCACDLTPTRLDDQNGCLGLNSCTTGAGGLCTQADDTIPAPNGNCRNCLTAWATQWAYCRGAGAQLCFQVECPRDGTLSIQAQAASGANGGCIGCNPLNYLFLYRGDYNTNELLGNVLNINQEFTCTAGEVFTLCEKQGIILTNLMKFRFTSLRDGSCPGGCTNFGCAGGYTAQN